MTKYKKLYLANENGDWWEFKNNSVIYALSEDAIPEGYKAGEDKFEQVIKTNGIKIEELFGDLVQLIEN